MTAVERIAWLFVLAFHATAAGAWWWLSPGGFPIGDAWSFKNRAAPILVLGAVAWAVAASRRPDDGRGLGDVLAAFPSAWLGLAAALAWGYRPPILDPIVLAPLAGAAAMGLGVGFRGGVGSPRRLTWVAAGLLAGVLVGAGSVPRPAGTRPRDEPSPASPTGRGRVEGRLGPLAVVHPGDGSITVRAEGSKIRLGVQPLLRFLARSPDGRPTILVPADRREGPGFTLVGAESGPSEAMLGYRADYDATLRVAERGAGRVEIEATAELPATIWSHLNAFCDVEVSGHRRLSLGFSPCPEARVEVRPMDYPAGRPLRFAFLDASGRFRVVEAADGEKGPFRELASGPLSRGEPLAITMFDEGRAVARLTLDDWSAQADVGPSPTAGWGAPVNAIEFCLSGDEPASVATLYVTLAATSVGRGWDCVGHRAGRYRNRAAVEVPAPGP